jgi:hypothetical protein
MERFAKQIPKGWVDSFLTLHAAEFFKTTSVSQENPRLGVLQPFFEVAVKAFREHVHNSCAELVLNLDEIGIRE